MRKLILVFVLWSFGPWSTSAQTNSPTPRLALIAEDPALRSAADLLTAQLTQDGHLALLERAEIERVYREQSLSAANKDYLKLGQILGADGLLLLQITRETTNQFLSARLVAVKPGVVIGGVRSVWPIPDLMEWAKWMQNHFAPLFPKLGVLAKDAVPISVVNLRSAINSTEARETEQQLTALTIERLTREKELFVLERRRMELLSEEKELNGVGKSAFWNGSYLLEGTLDRDGYSKETMTLHARLVPPQGGAPVEIALSGKRGEVAPLADQLAKKVLETLQRASSVAEWNPTEEAAKYFEEAKWALKWSMNKEAQAAAESAWALGKRDLDCALVRVKSYEAALPSNDGLFGDGAFYNAKGFSGAEQEILKDCTAEERAAGVLFKWRGNDLYYYTVRKIPDPEKIDQARHALELYYNLSQTLPLGELKPDSPWCKLGIETLEKASMVLQHFHFVPKSQSPVADKLAELRALARFVAAWVSQFPSVRDSYWVGDRVATHDELGHTIGEDPNIFKCKVNFGCFWQERPEDCVALYRELMSSPVFCYIQKDFWIRKLQSPHLAAWNAEDRKRIPQVWSDFVNELSASTNVLLQMEAKALEFADAATDKEMEAASDALFTMMFANKEVFVTNNVELLYLEWRTGDLIREICGDVRTPAKEKLSHQFYSEYLPRLEAMDRDYWNKSREKIKERDNLAKFEKQKHYLKNNTPYDSLEFSKTFSFFQYSKAQAAELQPLLAAYKSNLIAQAEGKTGQDKTRAQNSITRIGFLENDVRRVLEPPPAPAKSNVPRTTNLPPGLVATKSTNRPLATRIERPSVAETPKPQVEFSTNVLEVRRFYKIPLERLQTMYQSEKIRDVSFSRPRVREGKLLLDLWCQYSKEEVMGIAIGLAEHSGSASLILNPRNESWDVILQTTNKLVFTNESNPYFETLQDLVNSELLNGALYSVFKNEIRKFDLSSRHWQSFPFPTEKQVLLVTIGDHLLGANDEVIVEILNGGKNTRVLASSRRRPAASTLDSLDNFSSLILFPGPEGSIRASIKDKVYSWNGRDWKEDFALKLKSYKQPEVFADGIILDSGVYRQSLSLWWLPTDQSTAELCWQEEIRDPYISTPGFGRHLQKTANQPTPTWKSLSDLSLADAAVAPAQSNLYFFISCATNVTQILKADENASHHANLVCLDRGFAAPLVIPLKFNLNLGPFPGKLLDDKGRELFFRPESTWMVFTENSLFIGQEQENRFIGGGESISGFWAIPRTEIDAAFAAQKKLQQAKSLNRPSAASTKVHKP